MNPTARLLPCLIDLFSDIYTLKNVFRSSKFVDGGPLLGDLRPGKFDHWGAWGVAPGHIGGIKIVGHLLGDFVELSVRYALHS